MLVALSGLGAQLANPGAAGSAARRRCSCVWNAVATCSANSRKMFFTADEEPKSE